MNKILKLLFFIFIIAVNNTLVLSKENFFEKAMQMYESEKYEDAKFLFERNIVYNPKDAKTYLYLAKIYNHKEDQRKEEHNLETAILIEPNNEEALLMLMKIAFTFGSLLMTSRAPAITSALAPPPISRKFAGFPPT